MGKTLVSVKNLEDFICRLDKRIYVDNMILTPGAKDELSKRGVAIIYGPCPNAAGCQAHGAVSSAVVNKDNERLFYGIAAMLQSDYGIKDTELLKNLSCKAAKIIKDNL